jgi:hypothetical protein
MAPAGSVGDLMKWFLPLALSLALASAASGQDIPKYSMPVGAGPGAVGWGSVGPCGPGSRVQWNSPASTPVCAEGTFLSIANLFVAPSGNDTNNCSSGGLACLTVQRAVDVCPLGANCTINVSDGTYSLANSIGVNATYYRFISIVGNCTTPTNVTFTPTSNNQTLFEVQDHGLVVISCISIGNPSAFTGLLVFVSRQLAIMDVITVTFKDAMPGAIILFPTTAASLNCSGVITFSAALTENTIGNSTLGSILTLNCSMVASVAGGTIGQALSVSYNSVIDASPGSFSGAGSGAGTTGTRCSITNGTLLKPGAPTTIPGNVACPVTTASSGYSP